MSSIHLNKELRDFLKFEIKNILLFLEGHLNDQKEALNTLATIHQNGIYNTLDKTKILNRFDETNKKKDMALKVLRKIKKADEKESTNSWEGKGPSGPSFWIMTKTKNKSLRIKNLKKGYRYSYN